MSIYCSMPGVHDWPCVDLERGPVTEEEAQAAGAYSFGLHAGRTSDEYFLMKDEPCPGCPECVIGAPYAYDGSHVVVGPDSPRGGMVEWAVPATHIPTMREVEEHGRGYYAEDREMGSPHHGYIRLGVVSAPPAEDGRPLTPGMGDVVLDRRQVAYLVHHLTEWLNQDFVDDGFPEPVDPNTIP